MAEKSAAGQFFDGDGLHHWIVDPVPEFDAAAQVRLDCVIKENGSRGCMWGAARAKGR